MWQIRVLLQSMLDHMVTALGPKAKAAASAVTLATDDPLIVLITATNAKLDTMNGLLNDIKTNTAA